MGKDKLLPNTCLASILPKEPITVLPYCCPEHRPFDSADQSSLLPVVGVRFCGALLAIEDLIVEVRYDFFAPVFPFVPVSPYEGSFVPFFLEQLDSVMKLTHALSDVLRSFRYSQVFGGQRPGMEELLEPAVSERAKKPRPNLLASKPTQYLQLALTVNEMSDLRAVDSEK